MSTKIEMPKLSDTMTEGTLIKWHKKVGDSIEIGDILAEIETDKATMEMEAFDEGILTGIFVKEGEKAIIGGVLAELDGDDSGAAPAASPVSQAVSQEALAPAPATAAVAAVSVSASGDRLKVSPLARKIAAEQNIDLSSVRGTGPGGRIVKDDLSQAPAVKNCAATAPATTCAPAVTAVAAINPTAIQPVSGAEDQILPLSSMRKIIASRLLTSKTTIPHFYLHVEADVAPLMALRAQVNAQAEKTHGNKYSVNDFVLKAVVAATQAVPAVNASFAGEHIVQYAKVGLSVAIAVEDGLVTPVIKDAGNQSLLSISQSVKDFAKRAKDKKLKPNEFDGGTITVSNLGAWGIESFDAIVNPPQAAILSVGAAIEKAVVKNGQIVPGLRMNLGLSCDHRVIDGAVAAQFLNEVKKLIEQPALMLI